MIWARMLAYIAGTVDQELLLRNEYLAAEHRILRAQIKGRLLLSDAEKATLAEIAQRLGRKALEELSAVAKPDTRLAWYRKLIADKFDGSKFRKSRGRPKVDEETERLVVRMAKENPGWGYDRIVRAMANLGLQLSDQTVGNILRRHDSGACPSLQHQLSPLPTFSCQLSPAYALPWRQPKRNRQRPDRYRAAAAPPRAPTTPRKYFKLAAILSAGGISVAPNLTSCSTTDQPE
jgi:cytochrome P450